MRDHAADIAALLPLLMADVSKKVSMTPPQLAKLEASIKQLARETPLAATEIAGLVAQAGTFGIANEDLERFALLGSKVAIAFDMTGEHAADSLAHIKASLKLNMDQLTDYADAINYVADNTAASEEQLVDFVLRTGPGAMAAGLKPKDLLAIGSAMTEVGLESGRAGTAVNAMLTKMTALGSKKGAGKVLDQLGGKGYSKKLQKEFFENPTQALIKILRLTEKMSRPDRATFMKDLFGLETQDEVAALAGNVDRVVDTMEKLGDTAKYAGSVNKVFESFKNTTKNQWAQFTHNVELSAAALGAKLLPAINGSLHYLNNFFATAEGRVSILDRLSASANGFFNGLGYKGGAAEALSGVATSLKDIRDLIFGIQGDGMSGDKMAEIFHRWQQFGASLHDSPIATILDAITHANVSGLGSSLLVGAASMTALNFAARLALSPIKGILGALEGIVKIAYTLSGLRTAKWLSGLTGGSVALGLLGLGAGAAAISKFGPGVAAKSKMPEKGTPGWWLGINPTETREQRLQRLTGPKHFEEHERVDLSTLPDDMERYRNLQRFLNPPPQIQPKHNEFDTMLQGMDAAKLKAQQTGADMQSALNVTAAPVIDTASIDAALAKARQLVSVLAQAGTAANSASANVGGKVSAAMRQNLADGGN
ncbi:phage tail tape measure protein [Mesorhizobium tamadayense]|uniref:Phage tail tape measure protein n=1 Tax=Mesorhizobium tamadayense TaxID=425306 RepID=A0A3P3EPW8_9HYPH|nr:phage tail tape measure protein [Mesorhizobium tamadayense]RRH87428.1 phage tail tape measure protein [Mesorhizobium tamadayense]